MQLFLVLMLLLHLLALYLTAASAAVVVDVAVANAADTFSVGRLQKTNMILSPTTIIITNHMTLYFVKSYFLTTLLLSERHSASDVARGVWSGTLKEGSSSRQ